MDQAQMRARHAELLARYIDKRPQDRGQMPGIEYQLDQIECAMLDNPPAGCSKGLILPEGERAKGVPPLASLTLEELDIKVLTDDEILDIINDPNRTPPDKYVLSIHDQGQVGSCAGEAASGSAECRHNQDGSGAPKLNGYFPYHWSSGGADRGSTLDENLAILQEYGCASEAVWPRSKGFRATPSDAAMEDALNHRIAKDGVAKLKDRREFITMSLAGFPIQFGYTGHSIFCSNIIDLMRLEYANSWSAKFGNNGRGTLSFDRVYWGYGVYAVIAPRGKN